MGHGENGGQRVEQRMPGQEHFLPEDAETLFGKCVFGQAVTVVERGLRCPTDAKCGTNMLRTPIEDAAQALPIAHRFERHLLERRPGDDESVERRRGLVGIEHFVVRFDVALRRGLVGFAGQTEQDDTER